MSECKYRKCELPAMDNGDYCSPSHRACAARDRKRSATNVAQPITANMPADQPRNSCATPDSGHGQNKFPPGTEINHQDGSVEILGQPSPLADVETGPDTAGASKCYKDSGIPLPGDPGYEGVCKLVDSRWHADPLMALRMDKRTTRAEMLTRYAHG